MNMTLPKAFAAAAVACLLALPARAKDEPDAKARAAVAAELAKFASLCAEVGAKSEGERAAAEAEALAADAPGLAEAKAKLDAVESDAADAAAALAKKRAPAAAAVAKAYDKLAPEPKDAPSTEWFFRAVAWEPSKARTAKAAKLAADLVDGNKLDEGGRLWTRLQRADPEGRAAGRYDAQEQKWGKDGKLLLSSAKSPLVGWVSLPGGWAKGKSFPVLVAVDGAGANFLGCLRSFAGARGSRNVIVLSPCTLSNTNDLSAKTYPFYDAKVLTDHQPQPKRFEFDGPGVDALCDELRARFGGEEKTFHTGFSGGGMYTYWRLFQQPQKVRGAAPACANFLPTVTQGAPGAGDGGGPPVHILTGDKDPHREWIHGKVGGEKGIEHQSDLAEAELKRLGYTNVRRTMLPGVGHSSLPDKVWDFVDEVLSKR
ncbi:MAG: hypothetical protein HMLKMBBP_03826 [Planctomycetes bacterium]|nr:hypothetical protein [Planctomycetota bacterium]